MEALQHTLTEKEWNWIRCYFLFRGNASKASREVYGGTPGACRVKGWKKVRKFRPIIQEIVDREFYKMEYGGMSGIDFYLGNLEREAEEHKRFMQEVGGPRGLLRLLKKMR